MDFATLPELTGTVVALEPLSALHMQRDTVFFFSIIEGEWPTVRLGLTERLARRAPH